MANFATPKRTTQSWKSGSPLSPLNQSTLCNSVSRNLSSKKCTTQKSSIKIKSPSSYRLDVVQSDWTLTGTGGSPAKSTNTKRLFKSDRFISQKASCPTTNGDKERELSNIETDHEERKLYTKSVAEACGVAINTRILSFKPQAPESKKIYSFENCYNRPLKPLSQSKNQINRKRRKISTTPERVLDAPGLIDDYYLNLLDWSSTNEVAVGLDKAVYVWNAESGRVSCLMETSEGTFVTSVKWCEDGSFLSIGFADGSIQIWDSATGSRLRNMAGQSSRIGSMSWNHHILTSGSRNGSILNHDVRIKDHKISTYAAHLAEVCGLQWRSDGTQLASGGNDNLLCIWDSRSSIPKFTKSNHTAAVKAIAWCPWQLNLLCSGGGTADRKIHWWNTTTGARVQSIDTGSQVTGLCWSSVYKEIVSTHGWPDNQLSIWTFGSHVQKQLDIPAHESRVLHSSLSPDGQTLATAAADENLKFFKIWAKEDRPVRLRDDDSKNELRKCLTIR